MQEHAFLARLRGVDLIRRSGRVRALMPSLIEADGPNMPLGALCTIERRGGREPMLAEVVKVEERRLFLAPMADPGDLALGAEVVALEETGTIPAGEPTLGQALNALGEPLDGQALRSSWRHPFPPQPPGPLSRVSPTRPLETGIRAIDGLLTLGQGQRVGIFAPAGVGKTSLMVQLAGSVAADHVIICQIGERGREVETLWNEALPADIRKRATLIAATSDESAAMRARAAQHAIALADHWRARGRHVLLLIDSMTRLAMALRELGLAAGEPPTLRAYTPNVFSVIPKLVECCGALRSGGAISAIMTILAESEEMDDPISEMMKSILDGHILLSRNLAEKGHFPAIDVVRSISRRADRLVDEKHRMAAMRARSLLAQYDTSRTLIETGLYTQGSDAEIDAALEARPRLMAYLRQGAAEQIGFAKSVAALNQLAGPAVR